MRLDGVYTGPDINVPDGIRATGTPEEFKHVGPLPVRGMTAQVTPVGQPIGPQSVDIAPDKGAVRQIAKATEVQCTDQRLIDWMKTPDA